MRIFRILPVILLLLSTLATFSQVKKYPKPVVPPVLRSSLGEQQGKVSIAKEAAVEAIKKPLRIFEYKTNKEYSISSYQVIYRQKTFAEDENGKLNPSSVVTAQLFKSTPLPELWINELSSRLKPGEQINFFDIIAKDDKGRVMYAPELNITIK